MLRLKWRHVMIKINWIFFSFSVFCWFRLSFGSFNATKIIKIGIISWTQYLCRLLALGFLIKISKEKYKTSAYPMRTKSLSKNNKEEGQILSINSPRIVERCRAKERNQTKHKTNKLHIVLYLWVLFYLFVFCFFCFCPKSQ